MKKARHNQIIWDAAISAKMTRLKYAPSWFPFPAFIAIGFAIVFVGHIFFGLNPRLGNPAEVIYFDSEALVDGGIWISVSLRDDDIIVTTADRKIIKIPISLTSFDPIDKLAKHFIEETNKISISTGLAKRSLKNQSSVIISADQKLKYGHIKPILEAIARAGISDYGFETKVQLTDL